MEVDMNSISGIPAMQNYYKYITYNPILITIIVVIIIIYIFLFGSLGSANIDGDGSNSGSGLKLLGIIVASIFIVLVLINGFNYFLNINIVTSIRNAFSKNPEIDIVVNNNNGRPFDPSADTPIVPEIKSIEQVYHIPNNEYSYDDARAVCAAYGNRLANFQEVQEAYKQGGDWCSYGWSENQLALFPTQLARWKQLQKIDGHENDCGRPGINGGFIDNPNVRFGVNCFGYKPKITSNEALIMENTPLFPVTQAQLDFEKRVKHWKNKISNILIAPFNSNSWSRI
jgi:hypothetical protein